MKGSRMIQKKTNLKNSEKQIKTLIIDRLDRVNSNCLVQKELGRNKGHLTCIQEQFLKWREIVTTWFLTALPYCTAVETSGGG